jgi:hypothetical protein
MPSEPEPNRPPVVFVFAPLVKTPNLPRAHQAPAHSTPRPTARVLTPRTVSRAEWETRERPPSTVRQARWESGPTPQTVRQHDWERERAFRAICSAANSTATDGGGPSSPPCSDLTGPPPPPSASQGESSSAGLTTARRLDLHLSDPGTDLTQCHDRASPDYVTDRSGIIAAAEPPPALSSGPPTVVRFET